MTRDEFRAGDEWALRPSTVLGAPATRVEVLLLPKGRGGRCKIRHLEGELAGLEEFVANAHLRSRLPTQHSSKVPQESNHCKLAFDDVAERVLVAINILSRVRVKRRHHHGKPKKKDSNTHLYGQRKEVFPFSFYLLYVLSSAFCSCSDAVNALVALLKALEHLGDRTCRLQQ